MSLMRGVAGMMLAGLVLASCGGGDTTGPTADEAPDRRPPTADASTTAPAETEVEVVEFTWTTSYVGDGYGATVEVTGVLGEGWASYTMHGVPVVGSGGGDYADLIPGMVGAGINGFVDVPSGSNPVDTIDPAGLTEILVDGDTRWYRLPWLLDEAPLALGDAEWVQIDESSEVPPVDLVTYVLAERFDHALENLRRAAADGAPYTPKASLEDDEIAALFGPWVGAEGAIQPTGNAAEGEARWGVTYTYEPDGVDGSARAEVSWHTTTGSRPGDLPPGSSIDAERVSAAMR
jgi:hypothetical protein